jgi:hypothetical protein
MAFRRHLATILLATALLSTALLVLPDGLSVSSMAEAGEVEDLREELNATQKELDKVKQERDDYSQRLEDSTKVLIVVLFLLVGSNIIFFLNTKRTKVALLEYQKKMGIEHGSRPRKRRRG